MRGDWSSLRRKGIIASRALAGRLLIDFADCRARSCFRPSNLPRHAGHGRHLAVPSASPLPRLHYKSNCLPAAKDARLLPLFPSPTLSRAVSAVQFYSCLL
ncbi:hypothetical protein BJX76DRAFT_47089 [Aspergillus varians]